MSSHNQVLSQPASAAMKQCTRKRICQGEPKLVAEFMGEDGRIRKMCKACRDNESAYKRNATVRKRAEREAVGNAPNPSASNSDSNNVENTNEDIKDSPAHVNDHENLDQSYVPFGKRTRICSAKRACMGYPMALFRFLDRKGTLRRACVLCREVLNEESRKRRRVHKIEALTDQGGCWSSEDEDFQVPSGDYESFNLPDETFDSLLEAIWELHTSGYGSTVHLASDKNDRETEAQPSDPFPESTNISEDETAEVPPARILPEWAYEGAMILLSAAEVSVNSYLFARDAAATAQTRGTNQQPSITTSSGPDSGKDEDMLNAAEETEHKADKNKVNRPHFVAQNENPACTPTSNAEKKRGCEEPSHNSAPSDGRSAPSTQPARPGCPEQERPRKKAKIPSPLTADDEVSRILNGKGQDQKAKKATARHSRAISKK